MARRTHKNPLILAIDRLELARCTRGYTRELVGMGRSLIELAIDLDTSLYTSVDPREVSERYNALDELVRILRAQVLAVRRDLEARRS